MKSIVAMTYYQLMHSIALALTFEEKPFLYFCMEFLNPDESMLDRIAETGVFSGVKGITRRGEFHDLVVELRKTKDMSDREIDEIGDSLFEKYLEPLYAEELKEADPEDEFYIYNDFQWHYYYMDKHFKNIVGIEDGYGSLHQQIAIHVHKGDKERLYPFIEKGYFPEPLYKGKNIRKIISSRDFDDLDDYYRSKIQVWDFKEIVAENEKRFSEALLHIFDVKGLGIKENSSLYVGQPLDRSRYCTAFQNYLMCKKIMRNETEKGYTVYFKPHPADRNDIRVYGGDNIVVLPKEFPVEVFNYQDRKFDRLVTFGSTASSITTCAKESFKYFDKQDFEREDVSEFIKKEIEKEKVTIEVFIKVRNLTPETYINVYSAIFRHAKIRTRLNLLVNKDVDLKECKSFFGTDNASRMINNYKSNAEIKDKVLWHKELGWLKKWAPRYKPQINIKQVSSFDDWVIYEEAMRKSDKYDYMILVDEGNPMFLITKDIINALRIRVYPAIYYRKYTMTTTERHLPIKIALNPGYIGNDYSGNLINILLHREVVRDFDNGERTPERFALTIQDYSELVRKPVRHSLNVCTEDYLSKTDALTHYRDEVRRIIDLDGYEKDFKLGQIASIVYDYYDYKSIVSGNPLSMTLEETVEDIIDDEDIKIGVYKRFANAMLREKALTNNLEIIQEGDYYQTIKPVVDNAAKMGILKKVDNLERVKEKIRKIIKNE